MTAAHYTHSTLRERIAEHVFVGDALRTLRRLAIHAASTVALFLIEPWERKMQRELSAAPEPAE